MRIAFPSILSASAAFALASCATIPAITQPEISFELSTRAQYLNELTGEMQRKGPLVALFTRRTDHSPIIIPCDQLSEKLNALGDLEKKPENKPALPRLFLMKQELEKADASCRALEISLAPKI